MGAPASQPWQSPAPDAVEELRDAPPLQDADGEGLWEPVAVDGSRPIGQDNPPRRDPQRSYGARPTQAEVEHRIAEAQLWIAQRLPLAQIRANAAQNWGISNIKTISRYLALARERMVEELIQNRLQHQAEQIYGLNELIRQAMAAGQFNAAVGAHRVIAEIGGLLRAPLKAPEGRP